MFSNLYLEHYLESLESLPQELKRNFTSMHELDVKSKSILENLDAASDEYLRKVRELSPDRRKIEMEKIQAMFKKSKEHGDEKVKIAIKTYELVDKHIRRLDSDLAKFESEIKEKGRLSQSEGEDEEDGEENLKERPSQQQQHSHTSSTSSHHKKSAKKNSSNNNSSGGHAGNHSSSRQKKGDSKKSSKQDSSGSSSKRNLKDSASSSSTKEEASKKKKSSKTPTHSSSSKKEESLLPDLSKGPQEVLDMPVDPNEPTYCTCHQVSYGEMIGCDNVECPIEWFHFGCMGLNTKPKGRWYCPLCSHMFKKKK